MPKGKPRKKNPGLYDDAPQYQPSMAPQAVARKRGGTHRVRDGDATGSVYDTFNYKELVAAAKDRQVYVKDMKKKEMALALKQWDDNQKRLELEERAEAEKQKKILEKAKDKENEKKEARIKERVLRNMKREKRRVKGEEDVIEDFLDTDLENERIEAAHNEMAEELNANKYEQFGHALSDHLWNSTSSESSKNTISEELLPHHRLRLFEWVYAFSPLRRPIPYDVNTITPFNTLNHEFVPMPFRYAPLKITTTESREKLVLPGQAYPPGVEPDFAPVLPSQTCVATRNGILIGALRNAKIERASDWATRTLIQGWNGSMYFILPPRDKDKVLAEVYHKWHVENEKLLRVADKHANPADRARRHLQRHRNNARKAIDVYDASRYRPSYVCYMPAHLEPGKAYDEQRSLESLFYIRFPGCDVPHYYFWAQEGDWQDPTMKNSAWQMPAAHNDEVGLLSNREENMTYVVQPLYKTWTRIKKSEVNPPSDKTLLNGSISSIERRLHETGLAATLASYRTQWRKVGRGDVWNTFARALPVLYPSGDFPDVPPVETDVDTSVAVKIAEVQMAVDKHGADLDYVEVLAFKGDEPWTRDDDAFWYLAKVDVPSGEAFAKESNIPKDITRLMDPVEKVEALYRRSSATVQTIVSSSPGLNPQCLSSPGTLYFQDNLNEATRQQWEDKYLHNAGQAPSSTCPFCSMSLTLMDSEAQAQHVYSHSAMVDHFSCRSWTTEQHIEHALQNLHQTRQQNNQINDPDFESDEGVHANIDSPPKSTPKLKPKRPLRITTTPRKPTKRRRSSTQTFTIPSTPSSHEPSPFLPVVKRFKPDHPMAAWKPQSESATPASDELSPYLPTVKRYAADHPNAAWHPQHHPNPASTSDEPSPVLFGVKRFKPDDPRAAWKPEREGQGGSEIEDSLEVVRGREGKRKRNRTARGERVRKKKCVSGDVSAGKMEMGECAAVGQDCGNGDIDMEDVAEEEEVKSAFEKRETEQTGAAGRCIVI